MATTLCARRLDIVLLFACGTLVAFALVLAGCTNAADISSPAPAPAPAPELPERTLTLDEIRDLSMTSQAKAALHAGFPTQLPVMDGRVLDVRPLPVEGGEEWTYALQVEYPYAVVFEWYSRAYPVASWQIASLSTLGSDEGGGVLMELHKGDAVSRITILPEEDGARVEAGISIGSQGSLEL